MQLKLNILKLYIFMNKFDMYDHYRISCRTIITTSTISSAECEVFNIKIQDIVSSLALSHTVFIFNTEYINKGYYLSILSSY